MAPAGETLHVTNGRSAADRLRAALPGALVISWDDVLYDGPVRELGPALQRRDRASFIARQGWASRDEAYDTLAARDVALADAIRTRARIVLWFESDLYDQLQLLQVLYRARGAASRRLVLRARLGEPGTWTPVATATDDAIAAAYAAAAPLSRAEIRAGVLVWRAFIRGHLTSLDATARNDAALPDLSPAIRRLLEELPALEDGLARSERALLDAAAAGGRPDGTALFLAAQASEEAPFLGDTAAFSRIRRLIECDLLAARTVDGPIATMRLSPTRLGRRVAEGAAAIDPPPRWMGGTQIGGYVPLRWSRAEERVVRIDA